MGIPYMRYPSRWEIGEYRGSQDCALFTRMCVYNTGKSFTVYCSSRRGLGDREKVVDLMVREGTRTVSTRFFQGWVLNDSEA